MKRITSLLVIFLLSIFGLFAQGSSNIPRLKQKQEVLLARIESIEESITKLENEIFEGNSLAYSASGTIHSLQKQQKKINKTYKSNIRAIERKIKSKDSDISKEAKAELKQLNTEFKLETRALRSELNAANKELKAGMRQVERAYSKQTKEKQKLVATKSNEKVARKNLESAIKKASKIDDY